MQPSFTTLLLYKPTRFVFIACLYYAVFLYQLQRRSAITWFAGRKYLLPGRPYSDLTDFRLSATVSSNAFSSYNGSMCILPFQWRFQFQQLRAPFDPLSFQFQRSKPSVCRLRQTGWQFACVLPYGNVPSVICTLQNSFASVPTFILVLHCKIQGCLAEHTYSLVALSWQTRDIVLF